MCLHRHIEKAIYYKRLKPLHFSPTDPEAIVLCQAGMTLTNPSTYPDGAAPDSAQPGYLMSPGRTPHESTNSKYRMSFPI